MKTTPSTTPVIDMAGFDSAVISYWRWYSNDTGAEPNGSPNASASTNRPSASVLLISTVRPLRLLMISPGRIAALEIAFSTAMRSSAEAFSPSSFSVFSAA